MACRVQGEPCHRRATGSFWPCPALLPLTRQGVGDPGITSTQCCNGHGQAVAMAGPNHYPPGARGSARSERALLESSKSAVLASLLGLGSDLISSDVACHGPWLLSA